jgi:hypothetical protein
VALPAVDVADQDIAVEKATPPGIQRFAPDDAGTAMWKSGLVVPTVTEPEAVL